MEDKLMLTFISFCLQNHLAAHIEIDFSKISTIRHVPYLYKHLKILIKRITKGQGGEAYHGDSK